MDELIEEIESHLTHHHIVNTLWNPESTRDELHEALRLSMEEMAKLLRQNADLLERLGRYENG